MSLTPEEQALFDFVGVELGLPQNASLLERVRQTLALGRLRYRNSSALEPRVIDVDATMRRHAEIMAGTTHDEAIEHSPLAHMLWHRRNGWHTRVIDRDEPSDNFCSRCGVEISRERADRFSLCESCDF